MDQPVIFDNVNQRLIDDLKKKISKSSVVSIAASCFSIYAYAALQRQLNAVRDFRFIFTADTFNENESPLNKEKREFYIPKLQRERSLYGSEFELKLRNKLTQRAIARECAEWIKAKATFKTNVSARRLDGFMHVDNGEDGAYVYSPFQEFTSTELGVERGNNLFQTFLRVPHELAEHYLQAFNELWKNKEVLQDVTAEVISSISSVYKENAPEFIYFVTLYNIFSEFLDDISQDELPNEATGFKNSIVWNKLYNFQKDAALAIINKLEKYNGCILADSVGLGKTFTALAVIKYYENRNKSVLVLCPKKLNENWITYRSNYKNNPLAKDRLRYDVLFHTDLSRDSGTSNGLDLAHINWGNYDLVVIDESHNFRNGGYTADDDDDAAAEETAAESSEIAANNEKAENKKNAHTFILDLRKKRGPKKENRYQRLMNRVMKSGVKTKVLMLSATPVNNRFNDLKNQLQLAYEGDSSQIDAQLNTESGINDIFRQTQLAYNRWTKLPPEERTADNLRDALSFDFFEVLDAVTIARSRKQIQQYYDTAALGAFPERLPAVSRRTQLTLDKNSNVSFSMILGLLQQLNLAIYTPSDFIQPSKRALYEAADGFASNMFFSSQGQTGRERGVRRLMCINLLKRLESSAHSFVLTLTRMRSVIASTSELVDEFIRTKKADAAIFEENDELQAELDLDDQEDAVFIGSNKGQILLQDMDYISWNRLLKRDLHTIDTLLNVFKAVTPQNDGKLQQLKADIENKFKNHINFNNNKIIIFTAFADTAEYLYDNLAQFIKKKYHLNTALITGTHDARATIKPPSKYKLDYNLVLSLFSPVSKDKDVIYPDFYDVIDVLIATDCISEGQNLQDCDYLINFDIHWNPVRLIQRFGRIDRIGSSNGVIQMVNYWPDLTLDEYIDLKARVEARMKASVLTSTGDDDLLSDNEKSDLEFRRRQLQRLQHEVIDIEDMNSGVSIMDLGLNEFRLDLLSYLKDNPDAEHIPLGLHAVVQSTSDCPPGVIFVLKSRTPKPLDQKNRLHPFYLVYVNAAGEVAVNHLEHRTMLENIRRLCKGRSAPDQGLCQIFNQATKDGADMSVYSKLLNDAVASIMNIKEQSDVDSFLAGSHADLFAGDNMQLDDFELIDFLVVQ